MVGGAAPGWYQDPASSGSVRYWDGNQWTDNTSPSPYAQPAAWQPATAGPRSGSPNGAKRWTIVATAAVAAIALIAAAAVAVTHSDSKKAVGTARTPLSSSPESHPYRPKLDANGDPAIVPYETRVSETDAPADSLPPVLYSVPSGRDVVTPDSARQVTEAIWALRQQAIALEDANQLSTFETGSALAVDADRGCGCGHEDRFGPATNMSVAVPHQSTFPAWFYAQTRTTLNDSPSTSLLVFTRASRAQPWRLAFANGGAPFYDGTELSLRYELDGYASDVPAAVRPRAAQLASLLAAYYQAAKDKKRPPADVKFIPGTMTDQWVEHLGQNTQGEPHINNGLTGYYRFVANRHSPPYVVPLEADVYLACTSVIGQITFVASEGARATQPADRTNWGRDVLPGSYRAIVEVEEYSPCFAFTPQAPEVTVNGVTPPDQVTTFAIR